MVWKLVISIFVAAIALVAFAWYSSSVIVVKRILPGSKQAVWNLWNDPQLIQQWWGPHGFSCPLAKNDPQVGGGYLLGMQQDGSDRIDYNVGTYTEIIPMKRMVSSLSFSDATGKSMPGSKVRLPGSWPDSVQIEFDFLELSAGTTEVTITEKGIPLILKLGAKMGWEQQLDKIEKLLKK